MTTDLREPFAPATRPADTTGEAGNLAEPAFAVADQPPGMRHLVVRRRLLVAYVVALLLMAVLDTSWRGLIARDFYHRELATLLRAQVWLWPAVLLYLAYPAGLVLIALQPWPARAVTAAWRSAGVGLLAYGTHALSNLATVLGVNPPLAMVDIVWGTLASAVAGTAAWLIGRRY